MPLFRLLPKVWSTTIFTIGIVVMLWIIFYSSSIRFSSVSVLVDNYGRISKKTLVSKRLSNETPGKTSDKSCGLIAMTIDPPMGVGNSMFNYAAIYGLAQKLHRTPMIFAENQFKPDVIFAHLAITSSKPDNATSGHKFTGVKEAGCCYSDRKLFEIPCNGNDVMICCYTQSWKYFEGVETELRKQMVFREAVHEKCLEALRFERRNTSVADSKLWLIGIHLRTYQGDPGALEYGHPLPNMTFINKAMNYFRHKALKSGKTARFMVVTRDRKWVMENFTNRTLDPDVRFAEQRSWEVDFCMLTKTDHLIITSGTFAWWAAFLHKGEVVRQGQYCTRSSALCNEYGSNASDHYPEKWMTF